MAVYFRPDTLPELETVRPELRRALWAEALARARHEPQALLSFAAVAFCIAGGVLMGYTYAPADRVARLGSPFVGAFVGGAVGILIYCQVLTARVRFHLRELDEIAPPPGAANGENSAL